MIGAILGDIIGSRFEFHTYLGKDFELRRKMGNIGYERTKRGYTYEHFIDRYREIYQADVQEA